MELNDKTWLSLLKKGPYSDLFSPNAGRYGPE